MAPTHKGWFLLCPVLLAHVESDCPYMETRRFIPDWWLSANAYFMDFFMGVAELLGIEPLFPIVITGEIGNGPSA